MISDKLKILRKQHGLTQAELGEVLNISASSIGMYEQNRRTPDHKMLSKMCKYFGVTTDYMLSESNEQNRDIDDVLEEIKAKLLSQRGLMFNGKILDDTDLIRIAEIIELSIKVLALDATT
ncbi:MAG: helix-turn-helix transcriptional regulator [Oscillospiraceae bacterium]